jgi:hypothetical protein
LVVPLGGNGKGAVGQMQLSKGIYRCL